MSRTRRIGWVSAVCIAVILGILQYLAPNQSAPQVIPEDAPVASPSAIHPGVRQETARAVRVIDGDTIELEDGRKVRYIGIDTPETVDPRKPVACFGKEASEENKRLVSGKTVRMEKDISETDTFGRLLRYVYVEDMMVNESLVLGGFAYVSTYPPDVKYQQRFLQAQEAASQAQSGLWKSCPVQQP